MGRMLRALFAALFGTVTGPEPESVGHLRTLGAQLTEAATALRVTAQRARLLSERVDYLRAESAAWERRIERAWESEDGELIIAAAKMAGRVQGELEAARVELDEKLAAEISMREMLITERSNWFRLLEEAQRLGHDVSGCMTTIDLSRPPPPDDDGLPDDEEREFVGRIIDRMDLN